MAWYANALNELKKKPKAQESEVCNRLITPALMKVLGFSISEIDMDRHEGRMPDYVCTWSGSHSASVIVEAKRLHPVLETRLIPEVPVGRPAAVQTIPVSQLYGIWRLQLSPPYRAYQCPRVCFQEAC